MMIFHRLCRCNVTVALCSAMLLPLASNAQITEQQVILQGFENSELKSQWQAQLERARGEAQSAGRWSNPSLEFSQEDLNLPGGASEESNIWLRQDVDIAGVKSLQRKAAAKQLESAQIQQQIAQQLWQKQLREHFYTALAAQQKSAALKQLLSHLAAIEKRVEQRVQRGDASRFDALRIAKERALVVSQSASEHAKFSDLSNQLFSLINEVPQPLVGTLLPSITVTDDSDFAGHPQLQALQLQRQSAELQARAAARQRWPELTLGVGHKRVNEPDFSADGRAISIGVTLPLFDNGGAEKRIAHSQVKHLNADFIVAQKQLNVARQSALQRYRVNRDAAEKLQALTASPERSLGALAESSYQAGELNVMALIDAYQSELELAIQFIDTALEARVAFIQLQFLRGQ
ncbi:MAG TPA: TolC family protein [Marinagarivorans sp.]